MAVVTISQQLGSRGLELGRLVASALGYRFATGEELIAEAARRFEVSAEDLLLFDVRTPHFWERRRSESHRYIAFFRAVLLKKLAEDRLVAVGRSLAHYTPAIGCALRLRVVAPFLSRARQVAADDKIQLHAAERQVRDHDREVTERTRSLYGIEVGDATLYDIIVNSSSHSLDVHAAAVATLARSLEETARPGDHAMLRDAALAAQVHAALLIHPKVRNAQIAVTCKSGVVQLNGPGLVPPWDGLVDEVARRVDGVTDVQVSAEEPPIPDRSG